MPTHSDTRMYAVVRAGCAACGARGTAFAPLLVGLLDAPGTLTARCPSHAAALRCIVARACLISAAAARAVRLRLRCAQPQRQTLYERMQARREAR